MDCQISSPPPQNVDSLIRETDEKLAQAVASGASEHFEELIRRYQGLFFSLLLRLVQNQDDAMELAQDSFLKAYRHISQYNPSQPFRTWLLTIATHTAFNHLDARRLRKTEQRLMPGRALGPAQSHNHSPLLQVIQQEGLQRIDNVLARLSAKARATFTLHYQQGLTYEEISRITGESLSNVKVLVMRTRDRLRQELAAEGVECRGELKR